MARHRQPVVYRGADFTASDRWFAHPLMPSHQQQKPIPGADGTIKGKIERLPCAVERVAVKVESPVGLDRARLETLVPASIERGSKARPGQRRHRFWPGRRHYRMRGWPDSLDRRSQGIRLCGGNLSRQRPDRRGHPRPQRRFFSAERAHGQPPLEEAGSAPYRWRQTRRRSARPRCLRPRTYRTG